MDGTVLDKHSCEKGSVFILGRREKMTKFECMKPLRNKKELSCRSTELCRLKNLLLTIKSIRQENYVYTKRKEI